MVVPGNTLFSTTFLPRRQSEADTTLPPNASALTLPLTFASHSGVHILV
jgi:hypothetical protein